MVRSLDVLLTIQNKEVRPLGSASELSGFGIGYRWVCVDAPASLGKSQILLEIKAALADRLCSICPDITTDIAVEIVESGVCQVKQPGALVSGVSMRDLAADQDIPEGARFALFVADRVIQNSHVLDLLKTNSLVIQERGSFSTYVYQCVRGGVPFSVFDAMTRSLVLGRPDLLILLSPSDPCEDMAIDAYRNPPTHVLRLCAQNVALVSIDSGTPKQIARRIVDAICGRSIVIPVG